MCRMMGVVSRGPVYYDLFEEFADLATQACVPWGTGRTRARRQPRDSTGFDVSHPCALPGSLLSASYHLEDVRDPPENGV